MSKLPEGCGLCEDSFTEPRQLPCGHQFCAKCLVMHIKLTTRNNAFLCPTCKKSTPILEEKITVFNVKNIFPASIEGTTESSDAKVLCSEKGHGSMQLQLYCRDHDILICGECVAKTGSHRKCNFMGLQEKCSLLKENMSRLRQSAIKQLKDIDDADAALEKAEQEFKKVKSLVTKEHAQQIAKLNGMTSMVERYNRETDSFAVIENWKSLMQEISKDNTSNYRVLSLKYEVAEKSKSLNYGYEKNPNLRFSHKCGKDVEIAEGQKTAHKKREGFDDSVVLTEKILSKGEHFLVKIEKTLGPQHTLKDSLGIGVAKTNDFSNMDSLYKMESGVWVLQFFLAHTDKARGELHINGFEVNARFCNMVPEEGDIVGVTVEMNGDLCFLHNGKKLGVAARGIEEPFYGALDLRSQIMEVSIV